MTVIIMGFILSLVAAMLSFVNHNAVLSNAIEQVFNMQNHISLITNTNVMSDIMSISYSVGISLIILKFLKKGFETYILWTEGDASDSPEFLLTNYVRATITLLVFGPFYDHILKIAENIAHNLLDSVSIKENTSVATKNLDTLMSLSEFNASEIMTICLTFVFAIVVLVLWFNLLKKGVEIMLLKIGISFVVVGLVDNDKGIFKEYMQLIYQALATAIVQVFLFKLALAINDYGNVVIGITILLFSLNVPTILSKFLISSQSGGRLTTTTYHASRLISMAMKRGRK